MDLFNAFACNDVASQAENIFDHHIADGKRGFDHGVSNNLHACKKLVLRDAGIASDGKQRLIRTLNLDGGSKNPFGKNELIGSKRFSTLAEKACDALDDVPLTLDMYFATPRAYGACDDFFHLFILFYINGEHLSIREAFGIDYDFLHLPGIHLECFPRHKAPIADGSRDHD